MSVPELFYHQHVFLGCLGIRRIPKPPGPDRLKTEDESLAQACLHDTEGSAVLVTTLAFDDPASNRCPALASDGRCSIHADRKPTECRVVPLDALAPDHLQPTVLVERREENEVRGASCIAHGTPADYVPLWRGSRLVHDEYRRALEERRLALAQDKRFWGEAVFRSLEMDLWAHPERVAQTPTRGMLVMSMAPVLISLADVSDRCRARIDEYLDAQIFQGERAIRAARSRPLAHEAALRELGAFTMTHRRLRDALGAAHMPAVAKKRSASEREAIEAWLGLTARR